MFYQVHSISVDRATCGSLWKIDHFHQFHTLCLKVIIGARKHMKLWEVVRLTQMLHICLTESEQCGVVLERYCTSISNSVTHKILWCHLWDLIELLSTFCCKHTVSICRHFYLHLVLHDYSYNSTQFSPPDFQNYIFTVHIFNTIYIYMVYLANNKFGKQ